MWLVFGFVARLPVFFAGAAGLFICFRPGPRPLRRILTLVCLPAAIGLAALFAWFASIAHLAAYVSVLENNWFLSWSSIASAIRGFSRLGVVLHVWLFGMALVLLFLWRMSPGWGNSSLPLALPDTRLQDETWQRIQTFICISTVSTSMISGVVSLPIVAVYLLAPRAGSVTWPMLIMDSLNVLLSTAALTGVAAWACGTERWKELRQFAHLPETKFGLLGAGIPIALSVAANLIIFLWDRIHWAAFDFYRLAPPSLAGYFSFPQFSSYALLPAAAAEEIIWRGYLQPRFLRRYGVVRGIFLLGLVWGAFHFTIDFRNASSDSDVLVRLAVRLTICVLLSYVFGWLMLQSRSVWPAALAHGFYNIWLRAGAESLPYPVLQWILWGVLGYLLFRFWPPPDPEPAPEPIAEIGAEPTAI